jgi:regulatory protein
MLNRRDYGARELSVSLVARGFAQTAADAVVGQLAAEKLVDDSRFAEHFVAYHANRGQGPVRIAHRLREAGVAGEQIAAAVDANAAEWRQRCVDVRRRRFGAKPPATWAERGRQGRFLSQRGFSADQIRAAIGKDFNEE